MYNSLHKLMCTNNITYIQRPNTRYTNIYIGMKLKKYKKSYFAVIEDAHSRTPKQTPHFDTRSEINPSRTLVKNKIMKMLKSAQNIGNRARKCIWHCFSCEMGYLSSRLRSFTRLKARERFRRLC